MSGTFFSRIGSFAYLLIVAFFCGRTLEARAAPLWQPPTLRAPKTLTVPGLTVEPELTEPDPSDTSLSEASVRVRGRYSGPDSSLLWNTVPVKVGGGDRFELLVKLTGPITPLELSSVDPYGVIRKDRYEISFRDWDAYLFSLREKAVERANFIPSPFSVGLGISKISYTETDVPDYSSIVLTGKANYTHPFFSPKWTVGGGAFFTLLPLTENYSASARFLGVNVRLGYQLTPRSAPLKAAIFFGTYYTTMFVSGDRFGFSNMAGPQVYGTLQQALTQGRSVRGYLKFAPLASTVTALTLTSRELALGGEYVFKLVKEKPRSVQLDLSDMKIILPEGEVSAKTVSISFGYGF